MKKTYAVFGLGRYGIAVARELVRKSFPVVTYLPRGNKSDYDAYLDYYLRLIDRK